VSDNWGLTGLRTEARYGDRIVQCFAERLPCLGAYVARWVAERPTMRLSSGRRPG